MLRWRSSLCFHLGLAACFVIACAGDAHGQQDVNSANTTGVNSTNTTTPCSSAANGGKCALCETQEAWIVIGSAFFAAVLIYAVNHESQEMKYFSWSILCCGVAFFAALIMFNLLNVGLGLLLKGQDDVVHVTVSSTVLFLCFLCLQVGSAFASGMWAKPSHTLASDLRLAHRKNVQRQTRCWTTILGMVAGFQAMDLGSRFQQHDMFSGVAASFLVPVVTAALCALLFLVGNMLRRCLAPAHSEYAILGGNSESEGEDTDWERRQWEEAVEGSENQIAALAISFTLLQACLYAITHAKPVGFELEKLPEANSAQMLELLGLAVFFAAATLAFVSMLSNCLRRRSVAGSSCGQAARRAGIVMVKTMGMAFAWALLYATQWELASVLPNLFSEASLASRVVQCVAISCFVFLGIWLLDKIADADYTGEDSDHALFSMIEGLGLLIGFSWGQSFFEGLEVAGGFLPTFAVQWPGLGEFAIGLALVILVIAVWRGFILHNMLELHGDREESKLKLVAGKIQSRDIYGNKRSGRWGPGGLCAMICCGLCGLHAKEDEHDAYKTYTYSASGSADQADTADTSASGATGPTPKGRASDPNASGATGYGPTPRDGGAHDSSWLAGVCCCLMIVVGLGLLAFFALSPRAGENDLKFDCDAALNNSQTAWSDDKKEWCCQHARKGCQDESYDCDEGFFNWKKTWTRQKKRFCCKHKLRGCEKSLEEEHYNCSAGLAKWKTGWSESKKEYCCKRDKRGCDDVSEPYDCKAGLVMWETGWSTTKKEWCCKHYQLGCHPTTSSEPYDCKAGYSNWHAGWSVSKQHWCCRYYQRGCKQTNSASEDSIARTWMEEEGESDYDCEAGFARWRDGWSDSKKHWCCKHAKKGCHVTTSSLPYDCEAGYSNWEAGWSDSKKRWCCEHAHLGCSTSLPYDCSAGYARWQAGWSDSKKDWCCEHEDRGCSTTSSLPYDCEAGYRNWQAGWSGSKKRWCCIHSNRGCSTTSSLPYDCDAGYDNWQAGWADSKMTWCCRHAGRGCPTTSSLPYDCNAGYANWKAGWSESKKRWCCRHADRGCHVATSSLPYDCSAGYANWQAGWSDSKKAWCCLHQRKGCDPDAHDSSSYGGQSSMSTGRGSSSSYGRQDDDSKTVVVAGRSSSYGRQDDDSSAVVVAGRSSSYGRQNDDSKTVVVAGRSSSYGRQDDDSKTVVVAGHSSSYGRQDDDSSAVVVAGRSSSYGTQDDDSSADGAGRSSSYGRQDDDSKTVVVAGRSSSYGRQDDDSSGSDAVDAPFDCDHGLANFQISWAAQKVDWCCKHMGKGCS